MAKLKILNYTYMCLLGDYEYETTLKGKTISVYGQSPKGDLQFNVSLIDTEDARENVEKLNAKLNKIIKKYKKNGSVDNLLKFDEIKTAHDNATKKTKFINNFNRLGTTTFIFKKRHKLEKVPRDTELNYYFADGKYLKKHKKQIQDFLENLEDDRVGMLHDGSTLLANDNYFIMRNRSRNDFDQLTIVSNILENGDVSQLDELNNTWYKYLERITTKKKMNEIKNGENE